jgi:hypothetical protein
MVPFAQVIGALVKVGQVERQGSSVGVATDSDWLDGKQNSAHRHGTNSIADDGDRAEIAEGYCRRAPDSQQLDLSIAMPPDPAWFRADSIRGTCWGRRLAGV